MTAGGAAAAPVVVVFAGVDGGGGAGVLADCRAVAAVGGLPLAVTTAVTAQNLDGVAAVWHLSAARVRAQFACFAEAAREAAAVKVGVVGPAAAVAVAECARRCGGAPVVWDPVLAPSAGVAFAAGGGEAALWRCLPRVAAVATPNRGELLRFAREKRVAAAVARWFEAGCAAVLVTDVDGGGGWVRHVLWTAAAPRTPLWEARCERLPARYHGTGCLFSATLAARLARGDAVAAAAEAAHAVVWAAMRAAVAVPALGGQRLLR